MDKLLFFLAELDGLSQAVGKRQPVVLKIDVVVSASSQRQTSLYSLFEILLVLAKGPEATASKACNSI